MQPAKHINKSKITALLCNFTMDQLSWLDTIFSLLPGFSQRSARPGGATAEPSGALGTPEQGM